MAALTLQASKRRVLDAADPLEGVDALQTVLRLEPSLATDIGEMAADLLEFACRARASAARLGLAPASGCRPDAPPPAEVPAHLSGILLTPTRWKPPALGQLSSQGQERLTALRQQHPGVDDTWWLLNGRRTAGGICQRSPRPAAATLAYLEILLEESQIGPRRPP